MVEVALQKDQLQPPTVTYPDQGVGVKLVEHEAAPLPTLAETMTVKLGVGWPMPNVMVAFPLPSVIPPYDEVVVL